MRYALLSDIHAYPPALERVLADTALQKVDRRLCLGDVVGYGPDPVGAVRLCRESCDIVLAGNHDAAVARQISTMFFIPRAQEAVSRHRDLLAEEELSWLAELPLSVVGNGFVAAHGEFHRRGRQMEAGFGYVISGGDARRALEALPPKIQVVFVGHTHAACVWRKNVDGEPDLLPPEDFSLEPSVRYVVNVGAVGYPRSQFETNYVIFDSEARTVTFRHIPFDFEDYCGQLQEAGVEPPPWLTDRLRNGISPKA